jgi:hypothetical protein
MAFTDRVQFTVNLGILADEPGVATTRQEARQRGVRHVQAAPGMRLNGMFTWVQSMAGNNLKANLQEIADVWGAEVTQRMREKAPYTWKEHTEEAKKNLLAFAIVDPSNPDAIRIIGSNNATETAHVVVAPSGIEYWYPGRPNHRYGRFLEIGMGGRFAVIWPTFQEMRPQLITMLKDRIGELVHGGIGL